MTPITLFTYARPDHTQRTVEALLCNPGVKEHDLIVYSDAPRTPDKAQAVASVREYLKTITSFRLKKHLFWLLRMPMILGEKVNQTKEDVLIKQVGKILFSWTLKEKSIQLFKIS